MQLFVLGINHHTATVDLRARVAILPEQLPSVLQSACHACGIADAVIVSTCNRTEIYAQLPPQIRLNIEQITAKKDDTPHPLSQWFATNRNVAINDLLPHLYHYQHLDAVKHLMRVACGLDSMVLGEPQILGQVKAALAYAKQAQTASTSMVRIFEHIYHIAKRVRTQTALGAQAVSMGFAVVKLAKQMFSHLNQSTALLVATGEMNVLVGKHLVEQGIGRLILCNRSIEKAQNIAQELHIDAGQNMQHCKIEVYPWDKLVHALYEADIVSSCTGSMTPVILTKDIEQAIKQRKHQPILIIDLAVPRDVEASAGNMEDVFLYTVDDLQHVIEGNIEQRKQAAIEAENMVADCLAEFDKAQRTRLAGPAIAKYRQNADTLRQVEVNKALNALNAGQNTQEVIERLAQALTAKLTHAPSQLLRYAGSLEESDMLETLLEVLGVGGDESS